VNWDAQRLSFGPAASLYDRVRPRYPVEALRWMLGETRLRVVDLGAGTGILTRQLIELGHDVVPVEPDAGMRARLDESLGTALAVEGSAEHIPLPDASVDAVIAGQAYHWFNREPAHEEIARVLRPGGVFAPVWNVRDEREPWVAKLSEVAESHGDDQREPDSFGDRFGPVEKALFAFERRYTTDLLVDLVKSRSYYLTATPDAQQAIEHAVRTLVATHPALAGKPDFPMPYVTEAYRARRS
jgi:SAM-dependent methyltransferase